jgi:hypothetical protein
MEQQHEHSQLLSEAEAALQALDNLHIMRSRAEVSVHPGGRWLADRIVDTEVLGKSARIVVEAKCSGYPRDMQLAVAQVMRYAQPEYDPPTIPMIIAPTISPGGRALLREKGVAYWDRSGSLYLPLPWAHYDIERPTKSAPERRIRSLYRGRSAQVLHALLHDYTRAWHVEELAAEARVSPYTGHRVLVALEQALWVERSGRGPQSVRLLRDPGALLDAWAEEHTLGRYRQHGYFGWSQSNAALLTHLTDLLNQQQFAYALTLESGATLLASHSTAAERVSVLVPAHADLARFAAAARLDPAEDGANVVFLQTEEDGPFLYRQEVGRCWVASPVQLYLDLWKWPRRGREQAAHLRRERLAY